jgi:hypothetical protein
MSRINPCLPKSPQAFSHRNGTRYSGAWAELLHHPGSWTWQPSMEAKESCVSTILANLVRRAGDGCLQLYCTQVSQRYHCISSLDTHSLALLNTKGGTQLYDAVAFFSLQRPRNLCILDYLCLRALDALPRAHFDSFNLITDAFARKSSR